MPRYAFHAADAQGATNRGFIEAAHEDELYACLKHRGLNLIEWREKKSQSILFANNILLSDQVLLCRHLLALVRAGVQVHLALKDMVELCRQRITQQALQEIHATVMQGSSLSSAFAAQGTRFDPLFGLLLRAGENTGRLAEALAYLQESLAWKDNYATKLRRMMIYPVVQMIFAVIATLVLLFVAVPQIMQLFGFLGQDLPLYSTMLLLGVKMLGVLFAIVLVVGLVLVALLPVIRAQSENSGVAVDAFLLRLPLLGPLLTKMALARLAQLFAAMLESGVGMNEALQALPNLTENKALARELESVRHHISGGQGFAHAFERALHLPAYMVRLLKVGEDGGELNESLKHVATFYQQEATEAMEAILKASSLFVTGMVGIVLAAIVMGVVYPLYQGLGAVMGAG